MIDFLPMEIAASGMAAERMRMNALASNLANAHTTRTAEGGPFQPLEVVFRAEQPADFQTMLDESVQKILDGEFSSEDRQALARHLRGVKYEIVSSDRPPVLRYEPEHPDADPETGIVQYPDVSPIEQMTNLMAAARMYEANAAVSKMTKGMLERAIDLMGS